MGDTIHIKGHTSDFTQNVDSIQVDHQPVTVAKAGQSVGIRMAEHAHERNKVFKVVAWGVLCRCSGADIAAVQEGGYSPRKCRRVNPCCRQLRRKAWLTLLVEEHAEHFQGLHGAARVMNAWDRGSSPKSSRIAEILVPRLGQEGLAKMGQAGRPEGLQALQRGRLAIDGVIDGVIQGFQRLQDFRRVGMEVFRGDRLRSGPRLRPSALFWKR